MALIRHGCAWMLVLAEGQMIPEISEFSYGFALTNELLGWDELNVAPIFPSLIEEGREGGGYDVNLDFPGAPLFLQFKRSEYMSRRSASEYKKITQKGDLISVPFYRFPITEKAKSDQHDMLLELEADPMNLVYYVAPRFHTLAEINSAWTSAMVASRSEFVRPSDIGPLDHEKHTVAFDGIATWICSEPRKITASTSRDVFNTLKNALVETAAPLRETLPELVPRLHRAESRGLERIANSRSKAEFERARLREEARMKAESSQHDLFRSEPILPYALSTDGFSIELARELSQLESPEPTPVDTRGPAKLDKDRQVLREAADIAAHVFNAQLVFVQSKGVGRPS